MKSNRSKKPALSQAPSSAPKHVTAVIGKQLINLSLIGWTKRYQPLNDSLENLTDEALSRLGIGINSLERQLAFEALIEPEKQEQFLKLVRDTLAKAGFLNQFFEMPDGTVLLPELVHSADYGQVKNGWRIRLYSPKSDKPFMTCLCSSESECIATLHALADRLNDSITQ